MISQEKTLLDSLSTEAKRAAKTLWNELKCYEPKDDRELMFLHYYKEVLTEELLESNRSLRKKGTGNYGNN